MVFIAGAAACSLAALLINLMLWPGWMYAGTGELLVLLAIYALSSTHWSGMTVRFGILTYAVSTGLIVVARTHASLMGDFTYGNGLGPFAGNVGLLLGLPWFLMVMLSFPVAIRYSENIYLRSLIGAILILVPAIFFFYNCEALDFIYWTEIFPPVKAFITWFVAGFFLHFAANQMQVKSDNSLAVPLYVTWLAFNICLLVGRMLIKN